jgi:hypothetical protein
MCGISKRDGLKQNVTRLFVKKVYYISMSKKKKIVQTIVLARVVKERHHKQYSRPYSMIWLREGSEEDVVKAQQFATKTGYRVFLYPPSDPDPLEHARHDVLDTYFQSDDYQPRPFVNR